MFITIACTEQNWKTRKNKNGLDFLQAFEAQTVGFCQEKFIQNYNGHKTRLRKLKILYMPLNTFFLQFRHLTSRWWWELSLKCLLFFQIIVWCPCTISILQYEIKLVTFTCLQGCLQAFSDVYKHSRQDRGYERKNRHQHISTQQVHVRGKYGRRRRWIFAGIFFRDGNKHSKLQRDGQQDGAASVCEFDGNINYSIIYIINSGREQCHCSERLFFVKPCADHRSLNWLETS